MGLMDLLDDFVFGPLNLINRAEGLLRLLIYRDSGVRFAILREDKGGLHSLAQVRTILKRYGVVLFGCTHDAQCIYFTVKKRQADWAEYLLLHAGVALHNPPINPRNLTYATQRPAGWMPRPWSEQAAHPQKQSEKRPVIDETGQKSTWQKIEQMLNDMLG